MAPRPLLTATKPQRDIKEMKGPFGGAGSGGRKLIVINCTPKIVIRRLCCRFERAPFDQIVVRAVLRRY
jgi:hypothetical protein